MIHRDFTTDLPLHDRSLISHPWHRLSVLLTVALLTSPLFISGLIITPAAHAQQAVNLITVGGIGTSGTIIPVAGTGQAGFSGDGG